MITCEPIMIRQGGGCETRPFLLKP